MNDEQLMSNIKKIYNIKRLCNNFQTKINENAIATRDIGDLLSYTATKHNEIINNTLDYIMELSDVINDNIIERNPLKTVDDNIFYVRFAIILYIINSYFGDQINSKNEEEFAKYINDGIIKIEYPKYFNELSDDLKRFSNYYSEFNSKTHILKDYENIKEGTNNNVPKFFSKYFRYKDCLEYNGKLEEKNIECNKKINEIGEPIQLYEIYTFACYHENINIIDPADFLKKIKTIMFNFCLHTINAKLIESHKNLTDIKINHLEIQTLVNQIIDSFNWIKSSESNNIISNNISKKHDPISIVNAIIVCVFFVAYAGPKVLEIGSELVKELLLSGGIKKGGVHEKTIISTQNPRLVILNNIAKLIDVSHEILKKNVITNFTTIKKTKGGKTKTIKVKTLQDLKDAANKKGVKIPPNLKKKRDIQVYLDAFDGHTVKQLKQKAAKINLAIPSEVKRKSDLLYFVFSKISIKDH